MVDSDEEEILYANDLGRNLIGGKREKTVDDVLNGDKKDKRKLRKTLALCMAFLCLGLCRAILGPTLLSLQQHLHTTLPKISWVFAGRSIGYLSGAILGGMLFETFNALFLLAVCLLLCGIGIVIAPYVTTVLFLAICMSSVGIGMAVLDTGANILCLRMWGKKRSGTMLQALHFSFAVGACIAPLVAAPFLVETNSPMLAGGNASHTPLQNSTLNVTVVNSTGGVHGDLPNQEKQLGMGKEEKGTKGDENNIPSGGAEGSNNSIQNNKQTLRMKRTDPKENHKNPDEDAETTDKGNGVTGEGGGATGEGTGAKGKGGGATGEGAGETGEGAGETGEGAGAADEGAGATGEGAGATGEGAGATGKEDGATGKGAEASGEGAGATGKAAGVTGEGAGATGERAGAAGKGAGTTGEGAGAAGEGTRAAGKGAGATGDGAGATGDGTGAKGDGAGATGEEGGATGEGAGATGEGAGGTGEATGAIGKGAGATGGRAGATGKGAGVTREGAGATGKGTEERGEDIKATDENSAKPLSEPLPPQNQVERFAIAYIIVGVSAFVNSGVFFYFLCTKPKHEPQYIRSDQANDTLDKNSFPFRARIITLLFFFYFLYVGGEVAYGGFVSVFARKSGHRFEPDRASYVAAVFWGMFSLGRGIAICLASVISPLKMVIMDMMGCVATSLALTLFADKYESVLWIGSALLGLSMASLFPSGIAWLESYTPVTGNTASFLIVGSALGEMCVPVVIGYLFNQSIPGPMVLMYWMLATSGLSLFIFIYVMWLVMENGLEKSVEEALPSEELSKNSGSSGKQMGNARTPPIPKKKDHKE